MARVISISKWRPGPGELQVRRGRRCDHRLGVCDAGEIRDGSRTKTSTSTSLLGILAGIRGAPLAAWGEFDQHKDARSRRRRGSTCGPSVTYARTRWTAAPRTRTGSLQLPDMSREGLRRQPGTLSGTGERVWRAVLRYFRKHTTARVVLNTSSRGGSKAHSLLSGHRRASSGGLRSRRSRETTAFIQEPAAGCLPRSDSIMKRVGPALRPCAWDGKAEEVARNHLGIE